MACIFSNMSSSNFFYPPSNSERRIRERAAAFAPKISPAVAKIKFPSRSVMIFHQSTDQVCNTAELIRQVLKQIINHVVLIRESDFDDTNLTATSTLTQIT